MEIRYRMGSVYDQIDDHLTDLAQPAGNHGQIRSQASIQDRGILPLVPRNRDTIPDDRVDVRRRERSMSILIGKSLHRGNDFRYMLKSFSYALQCDRYVLLQKVRILY